MSAGLGLFVKLIPLIFTFRGVSQIIDTIHSPQVVDSCMSTLDAPVGGWLAHNDVAE